MRDHVPMLVRSAGASRPDVGGVTRSAATGRAFHRRELLEEGFVLGAFALRNRRQLRLGQ